MKISFKHIFGNVFKLIFIAKAVTRFCIRIGNLRNRYQYCVCWQSGAFDVRWLHTTIPHNC